MNAWKKNVGKGVRKTVAILCLVCLLACFGTVWVSAAGNAIITVASGSAEQNSSVSLVVRLDGNPGLWGLKLKIGYDSSAMTLDAVDAGNLFSEDDLTYSESLSINPYVIVASRGRLANLTEDGTLVTLKFSVKAGAEQKDYPVTVKIDQSINLDYEDVGINTANGTVTVVDCLHQVKQWVTTKAAVCEETGAEVLTCKKCAATFETRSLPATGHKHTEVRGTVAATQTKNGYSGDTYCTDCGKLISKGKTIEKLPAQTKPTETKPTETKPTETKPAETKPTETKPTETKPTETKPVETKPSETKPADTQSTEIKPVETKPSETKPADTQSTETKPVETKPTETKPTETKPADTQPQITSGDQAIFCKDSDESLIFISDAEYEDFIRVEVDGVIIDADNYTVNSGSTIVTVSQDYLNTLDAGTHTLSIVSKTGTATADFTIEEAATQPSETEVPENTAPIETQSDEDGNSGGSLIFLIIAIVVCVLCAAGIAIAIVTKKKGGKYAKKNS